MGNVTACGMCGGFLDKSVDEVFDNHKDAASNSVKVGSPGVAMKELTGVVMTTSHLAILQGGIKDDALSRDEFADLAHRCARPKM